MEEIMSLYENWLRLAYDQQGNNIKKTWDLYLPLEQTIYEGLLETKTNTIKGKLADLARAAGMSNEFYCGFLDGISGALDGEFKADELDEESEIDVRFEFELLFRKMVEYKARHLHELPQWGNVFTAEEQERIYVAERDSRTVRNADKIGRNDPCSCGSGKKYKKCCGA